MGSGVVTVGRRPYAVGLYWENSPGGRIAQTAKEAARQPGQQADFYAVRSGTKTGRVPQFGLGQTSAGHVAGMPVFAACLANQQLGSWAGAFRLREGTVITIVRDDLIVPDGDQFFANETEARDRLLQEIGFGGLQRIYAPESWAISGSDTMPISLLMDERRDVKLRPVEVSQKTVIIGVGAVVALVFLLVAGWYYQSKQAEKEAAERARLDALSAMQAKMRVANPFQPPPVQYPPPDRKWEKQPAPMDVVELCRANLSQVPAAIVGWHFSHLKCDGINITISWAREKGFSRPPEKSTVNDTGSLASLTIPLSPLTPRGSENLLDSTEITRRYLSQDWPGTIAKAPDDPLPPPPPDYKGSPPWTPPPAPWIKRSFNLSVPELPSSLPIYFGDLPGTIVNSLGYSGPGAGWTIEGVIYENRSN